MIQSAQPVVAVDFEGGAAVASAVDPTETTTLTEDSNDDIEGNDQENMSSEATHSRKSGLVVPAGGDEAVAPAPTASSGSGVRGGPSPATTTTTTAAASSSGAAAAASSSSGLPLLSRKHRHGAAAGSALPTGMNTMNGVLLSGSNLRPMHYFSRLTDVRQMDIQSALDQMKTLLSTRPQVVYKTSYYRKQTKNHWARDDPAFCALQGLFLLVAAIAYSVAFRCTITGAISFLLYAVIWNWLGMGLVLATTCREIANRQLTAHPTSASHVRQQVEWLYAFDIHCNAFFPVFVVLCKKENTTCRCLFSVANIARQAISTFDSVSLSFLVCLCIYIHRRCAVFSFTNRLKRRPAAIDSGQYLVWSGTVLVLVYYAFGISILAFSIQYRGLFISHCRRHSLVCRHVVWLSLWFWLECGARHGSLLFYVRTYISSNNNMKKCRVACDYRGLTCMSVSTTALFSTKIDRTAFEMPTTRII
jgi:hypothetical protein